MINIVLTLVFSVVMLVFMIFPAMKITQYLETKIQLSPTAHTVMLLFWVIFLSLCIGVFLRFG
jgi:hypothetical protein